MFLGLSLQDISSLHYFTFFGEFMNYLFAVSLLWAFSFGLIKGQLTGLDAGWVSLIRLTLSFLIFLPFLFRVRQGLSPKILIQLAGIGGIQFGLMYILYIRSYHWLQAWQVALFTVSTPLYVMILHDGVRRRFHLRAVLAVVLVVLAASWIVYQPDKEYVWSVGFLLIQGANIAFAAGQVAYKLFREKHDDIPDRAYMAIAYGGAVVIALLYVGVTGPLTWPAPGPQQMLTLLYLGVVATGIGFWGWNKGAVRVNGAVLSIFNNLKIPLAILVSIFIFKEKADWWRLLSGSVIMGVALYLALKPAEKRA
ncbi:MAG: EamA family transporter [Calditrichaeota bacterium]|nr:MAG: EamA family transporter [Calditrichota bacterium]